MDLSDIEEERKKEAELRFQKQKEILKKLNFGKKYRWVKNNHNLFPERERLPPISKKKNDIDFE